MRVFAEDYLAESSPIDLLAVGGEGELIALRIGRDGDDAALLTHCLADIGWLRPRVPDFLKLAPTLGLEASAEPRAMLACPGFTRETVTAASSFAARTVELLTYHGVRERGQLRILLGTPDSPRLARSTKPLLLEDPPSDPAEEDPAEETVPHVATATRPQAEAPDPEDSAGGFRTGLRDEDLVLEPLEEEKSFD